MSRHNNNNLLPESTVSQLREKAGLFSCLMTHEVKKTAVQFKWLGPKIPEEEWHRMLAFFQWTNDTYHGESQVRWFVNPQAQTWRCWAFPQEGETGMSAKELGDHPGFMAQQNEQFPRTEGWLYFGTCHHHCNAGAFQSSTDQTNEQNQDGLHITVGSMNEPCHTLHERFYLCGKLIPHKLDWFWDIGEVMDSVPQWAAKLLPSDIRDRIARGQMCEKSPTGVGFPQQWKDNIIIKPRAAVTVYSGGLGYTPQPGGTRFQRSYSNFSYDLSEARRQLHALCDTMKIDEVQALQYMEAIQDQPFIQDLIKLMYRNDVSLDALVTYIEDDLTKAEEKPGNGKADKEKFPDYQGNQHGWPDM